MYAILLQVVGYALKNTMRLEMMSGGDEIFFLDDARNCLNIVAFHKWDRMTDVNQFRKTMLQRACQFPRLKSKVTKFLGKYMFYALSDEEMMSSMDKTMPIVTDIHNER